MTQDKIEFEVAFDSETYYIKGAYSVAGKNGLTNRQYVTDGRFNCYLVSFAIEKKVADAYGVDISTWDHVPFKNLNGIEVDLYATACHPSKMNWKQFDNATFIIHRQRALPHPLRKLIRGADLLSPQGDDAYAASYLHHRTRSHSHNRSHNHSRHNHNRRGDDVAD